MNKINFNIGDQVICIDADVAQGLKERATYTAEKIFIHDSDSRHNTIKLLETGNYHLASRFKLVGNNIVEAEMRPIVGKSQTNDPVDRPKHYTAHPSGIECIQITEHMGFNLGNALKYIWRADLKGNAIEDLKKARWYINREVSKRQK